MDFNELKPYQRVRKRDTELVGTVTRIHDGRGCFINLYDDSADLHQTREQMESDWELVDDARADTGR